MLGNRIEQYLFNPVTYSVFTTDEAIFRYPHTFPNSNPYFNACQLNWQDGTYHTKFFIDRLNVWVNPRRSVWATLVAANGAPVYSGIESGYTPPVRNIPWEATAAMMT